MITNHRVRLRTVTDWRWPAWSWWVALEVAAVGLLGRQANWWWLAAIVVVAVELRGWSTHERSERRRWLWNQLPGIVMGLAMTLITILTIRLASQVVLAGLYGAWLVWRERRGTEAATSLASLLVVQAAMFEALFLMAATWQTPGWVVVALVWAGAYASVYAALSLRGDRSAGVMAATWGVVAAEVGWVLMLWLITYTLSGGYVLVPQPALILTALAYVFGSILASSRQGNLNRARLAEYLVIAMLLVAIVVMGTSWRGNI